MTTDVPSRGGGGALRRIATDEARRPGERQLAEALIGFVLRRQSMHAKPVATVNGTPISFAQMKVLFHVPSDGVIALGRLADAAGVSAASMTQAIGRIEEAGLVVRERNEHDRRIVDVRMTDLGLRELTRFHTAFADDWDTAFVQFEDQDLQVAARVLDRLGRVLAGDRDSA